MGRPLRADWQEDGATLGRLERAEHDSQIRLRWHAVWLIRHGRSVREAAAIVGGHERPVPPWLPWYRQDGLAGIRAHRR
jgi:hypothetical protein